MNELLIIAGIIGYLLVGAVVAGLWALFAKPSKYGMQGGSMFITRKIGGKTYE